MLYDYHYWNDNDNQRNRDLRLLRENGCYWPTDREVLDVFNAVRRLTIKAKLEDIESEPKKIYWISLQDVMKVLGDDRWDGQITGDFGYEFCGFYSEMQMLRRARFLKFEKGKYSSGRQIIDVRLDSEALGWIEEAADQEMLEHEVLKACARYTADLEDDIQKRARQYDMVEILCRMAYRYLHDKRDAKPILD